GYDRDGYDKDGYKENGLDKDGYDRDGYNVIGYDREGYNKEGYDINGFDRNGFDVNGFDKNGYDKNGFNQEGFDVNGYDKNGFNKEGFNKEGFDKNGYNKEGYDKEGYDVNGLDKDGFNKEGWKNEVVENKDENGKLLSKIAVKTNKEGERVVEITTYSQDGKVASVSIEKYSEDGKILSKEVKKFDANNKVISTITEKFDDKGRKLSSIEKRADGTKTEKTYEYNDKNVCYETIYNYNKNGKASDLTYNHYDKNGNLTFNRKTTYKYSSSGALESYTSVATRNGKTITDKYDKNGKLISTTETLPAINKGKWYKPTKEYLLYKMLPFGNSEYKTAASMYGKNAAGLLALAGGKTTDFNKQITRTINSYKDANISGIDCAPYLSEKLHEQFDFDYGCDISKMKGYYFGPNTQFSKDIAANSNFRNYVLKNKDKLLNNVSPDKPQGYQFKSSDNQDLYLAFSWADIIECWQDKDGAIHLLVADTYDFNKTDSGSLSKVGYRAMREGTLKPFYTINEVVIKP
ncbi:MAG: hypothetical protein IKL52_05240, partial [Candidatus Gastranaerophilales bacterium]|nr:hypothetical protein [Candidatus Gastranaerophilales bacterium]